MGQSIPQLPLWYPHIAEVRTLRENEQKPLNLDKSQAAVPFAVCSAGQATRARGDYCTIIAKTGTLLLLPLQYAATWRQQVQQYRGHRKRVRCDKSKSGSADAPLSRDRLRAPPQKKRKTVYILASTSLHSPPLHRGYHRRCFSLLRYSSLVCGFLSSYICLWGKPSTFHRYSTLPPHLSMNCCCCCCC